MSFELMASVYSYRMSAIFETIQSRMQHHLVEKMGNIPFRDFQQPKPENPFPGETWIDVATHTSYVWMEVEHNALDDLVKGVEGQEIKHYDWVPLLKGYLGQNLFGAILDEVNFMRPEDDDE